MIDLTGCIAIPLLKKSAFTGSYQGMRYRLKKETTTVEKEDGAQDGGTQEGEARDVIQAVVWPEPFSFSATPDEQKEGADFPFSKGGLTEAIDWLNQKYKERFEG